MDVTTRAYKIGDIVKLKEPPSALWPDNFMCRIVEIPSIVAAVLLPLATRPDYEAYRFSDRSPYAVFYSNLNNLMLSNEEELEQWLIQLELTR